MRSGAVEIRALPPALRVMWCPVGSEPIPYYPHSLPQCGHGEPIFTKLVRFPAPEEPTLEQRLEVIERKLDELLELERSQQLREDYDRLTAAWRARGGP